MPAVSINARPEPIRIDPERTAVIVVDMQNDFASEGGLLANAGIDISPIKAVVPAISRVVDVARRAGSKVIYLKMEFRPDLSDIGAPDSPNAIRHRAIGVGNRMRTPEGGEGRFLVRGTWNTEILNELNPEDGDIIISKSRYSGFFGTELDTVLKTLGVRSLIFTGCTTSVCVESTLRDAAFRDYVCLLLADCTAEPIGADLPRTNHDASLTLVEALFGWVSDSASLITALDPRLAAASR
jgi:ureidoacrylate peracid hydrolase